MSQNPDTEKEINDQIKSRVEADKNAPPSFVLKVVLHPDGLQIQQTPFKLSPFDVIGILEIVKSMHTKYFHDMMGNPGSTKIEVPTEDLEKKETV